MPTFVDHIKHLEQVVSNSPVFEHEEEVRIDCDDRDRERDPEADGIIVFAQWRATAQNNPAKLSILLNEMIHHDLNVGFLDIGYNSLTQDNVDLLIRVLQVNPRVSYLKMHIPSKKIVLDELLRVIAKHPSLEYINIMRLTSPTQLEQLKDTLDEKLTLKIVDFYARPHVSFFQDDYRLHASSHTICDVCDLIREINRKSNSNREFGNNNSILRLR